MKKYFFFAAAAIVAASCAKTPAPVQTPDGPEAPAVEGKVAVEFSSNIVTNVTTKGNGPVEGWNNQNLYIYGFQRIKDAESNVVKDYEHPFITCVESTAPASGNEGKINVYESPNTPYYYNQSYTYDFYGFYVDDAATVTTKTDLTTGELNGKKGKKIAVAIDGSQDLMYAYADPKASVDTAIRRGTAFGGASVRPGDWKDSYAFSAYAARRGVHPFMTFKHALTRINVKVNSKSTFTQKVSGNDPLYAKSDTDPTETTDPSSGLKILTDSMYVTKVLVGSWTKADFYVAGDTLGLDLATKADSTGLEMKQYTSESDKTLVALKKVGVKPSADGIAASEFVPVGCGLMVFPSKTLDIYIELEQDIPGSTRKATSIVEKVLKMDDVQFNYSGYLSEFAAGYQFDINLTVYGLEQVDITAELTPWKNGGSFEIDTDEVPSIF